MDQPLIWAPEPSSGEERVPTQRHTLTKCVEQTVAVARHGDKQHGLTLAKASF